MFKVVVAVFVISMLAMADIDVENDLSEKFRIGGYIDAGFTEFGQYNAVPSRQFAIRRSGFELNAELTETLKAEIKYEVRPDNSFLKDAVICWEPADWARARVGQFKRETLLAGGISSWNLNMFERPLVYDLAENLTYAGRDIGFDLKIDLPSINGIELTGIAGLFNGDERAEERIDNELLYTFRGEIAIPSIDLSLGASAASHRMGREDTADPSGYIVSARQNAFSADVDLNYKISNWYDLSFAAEICKGDNWSSDYSDVIAGEEAPGFVGLWGSISAFYHPWNVQGIETISLSLSYNKLEKNNDLSTEETRLSIIGAVYPSENLRLRFGGVRNTIPGLLEDEIFTDYIAEVGLRF